jgi:hypothetical protein
VVPICDDRRGKIRAWWKNQEHRQPNPEPFNHTKRIELSVYPDLQAQ